VELEFSLSLSSGTFDLLGGLEKAGLVRTGLGMMLFLFSSGA